MADLRVAGTADVGQLQQIAVEAYRHYVPLIGRPPAPMLADYAELVATGEVWVVEESVILGFVALRAEPDHLQVQTLAVRPASQGHGLGGRLMAFAETEARRVGLTTIALYTNEVMVDNLAWYARLGYIETHRAENDGFRRIYLRKSLNDRPQGRTNKPTGRSKAG